MLTRWLILFFACLLAQLVKGGLLLAPTQPNTSRKRQYWQRENGRWRIVQEIIQ